MQLASRDRPRTLLHLHLRPSDVFEAEGLRRCRLEHGRFFSHRQQGRFFPMRTGARCWYGTSWTEAFGTWAEAFWCGGGLADAIAEVVCGSVALDPRKSLMVEALPTDALPSGWRDPPLQRRTTPTRLCQNHVKLLKFQGQESVAHRAPRTHTEGTCTSPRGYF